MRFQARTYLGFAVLIVSWMEKARSSLHGFGIGNSTYRSDLVEYSWQFQPNHKVPRHLKFLETELPKGASGKVPKRLLRELFWPARPRAITLSSNQTNSSWRGSFYPKKCDQEGDANAGREACNGDSDRDHPNWTQHGIPATA
jgi:hypothetical protein